jgi:hypothetical protein
MDRSGMSSRSLIRRLHGRSHGQGRVGRERSLDRLPSRFGKHRHRHRRSPSANLDEVRRSRSPIRPDHVRRNLMDQLSEAAGWPGSPIPYSPAIAKSGDNMFEIGNLDLPSYYRKRVPHLQLVGDPDLHLRTLARLQALGISICQVLSNTTEDELMYLWSMPIGIHDDLGGPGLARSFIFQLRRLIIQQIDRPRPSSVVDQGSPGLAGALESLASATHCLKRKRKPYDRDIDSSEDEVTFDLGVVLDTYQTKAGSLRSIQSSCFGDLKRLHQLSHKVDRRPDNRVPFLAQSSIEDWHPSWVGADLSKEKKSNLLKSRSKDLGSKGFASFLSNVMTFMLSHLAIRQIELPTIVSYISILCRFAEERGSAFAIRYHNLLHNQVLDRIRISEKFSLDQLFSNEQDSLIRKIESRQQNNQTITVRTDYDPTKKPILRTPPKVQNQDRQSRKLVCLKHRPHENVRCSDPDCQKSKEHLDTTKPDLLIRFNRAAQAAEARKSGSRGSSSKLPSNQSR